MAVLQLAKKHILSLLVLWIVCLLKVLQWLLIVHYWIIAQHYSTLTCVRLNLIITSTICLFVLLFISIIGENTLVYLCLCLVLPIAINVINILNFINVLNRLTMKGSRPSYRLIYSTPSSCMFTKIPFACYPITRCSHGQCLPRSFFMNECHFNFAKSWCSSCVLAFKIGAM